MLLLMSYIGLIHLDMSFKCVHIDLLQRKINFLAHTKIHRYKYGRISLCRHKKSLRLINQVIVNNWKVYFHHKTFGLHI